MKRPVLLVALLMAVPLIGSGNGDRTMSQTNDEATIERAWKHRPATDKTGIEGSLWMQEEPVVETIKISGGGGNNRYPGVCENARGDRLIIYRGANNLYWYSFYRKGGSWSNPQVIAGQPQMDKYKCSDIEADSKGRFHCIWEEPGNQMIYGSFLDGTWRTPFTLRRIGKHDMGVSIGIRSNDEVIAANSMMTRSEVLTKDIFCWFKGKNDSFFVAKNMTGDGPSSTLPAITVDDNDHLWLAYKTEPKVASEWLDVRVIHFNKDNKEIERKMASEPEGWNFWPQIAINSERKVMVTWIHSQVRDYESRLYNTEAKKWTEVIRVKLGASLKPWFFFWSKMVSHDKDFYFAAMDPGRILHLLKFNEQSESWEKVVQISKTAVEYFDLYSGYDKLLIAWNTAQEPSSVYLTTVGVESYSKVRIQSVANLTVEKRIERGFFHGYYLNALTWEANPSNVERELVITAHRIYRKGRTEDNDQWKQIAEIAGNVMTYEDRNIAQDSDYVYAVTCVDDNDNESVIPY